MELNLDASASEDVADAPTAALVSDEAMSQTYGALDGSEDTGGVYPVQPAQGDGVKAKSRKPQKRAAETVEQEITSEPIPEAEMLTPSVESKVAQRRITKRLAAAAQLPRHERWKGRLHPAAW
jgi:hypothetical protein